MSRIAVYQSIMWWRSKMYRYQGRRHRLPRMSFEIFCMFLFNFLCSGKWQTRYTYDEAMMEGKRSGVFVCACSNWYHKSGLPLSAFYMPQCNSNLFTLIFAQMASRRESRSGVQTFSYGLRKWDSHSNGPVNYITCVLRGKILHHGLRSSTV